MKTSAEMVKLFAVARQRAGAKRSTSSCRRGNRPAICAAALAEQHPTLADVLPHVRFAVNSEYATDAP